LLAGTIAYPGDALPQGIVASEAMKGEVLLCQAQPRSHLVVLTRVLGSPPARPIAAVAVEDVSPLTTGGSRVALRQIGEARVAARPGHFVDAETAAGARERAGVVAVDGDTLAVEVTEISAHEIVRIAGPFDGLR
jgi:hypothetical protein